MLNTDYQPIRGLYAAGELVGGLFYFNYPGGTGLMAGAVLTETIFSWPGVGYWLIDSIGRRDYPALQGGVLLISTVVIGVNLIVDLVYGVIDPRIRHGR